MKEVTLSLAITISKLESDKLVLNKRIAELEEELLEIRSDYQCRCTHRVCRICEQRKSIDKILAKGGTL
jgi:plasmid rolling circle replication initiator protein Rep